MNAADVATQLDKRIAAALKATAGTIGPLRGSVDRLNDIHKLFKAQRANCKMTETDYAEKATQLLDILGDFEGLIAELAEALRDRPAIAAMNVSGTTGHRRVRIYRRMI
jgi:hypothetical protein